MSLQAPLKTMTVTGAFGMRAVPGTGLKDKNGVPRHIGVDLRATIGTPFYAPGDGKVLTVDMVGNIILEVEIDGKWHRFLHLKDIDVKSGTFKKGRLLGWTGNTGGVAAHLHWDVRKKGTAWNASYYNYEDPMKLIKEEDVKTTKSTAIWLVRTLTHEHNPPKKVWQNWVGLDDEALRKRLAKVYNDDWFKAQTVAIKSSETGKVEAFRSKVMDFVKKLKP